MKLYKLVVFILLFTASNTLAQELFVAPAHLVCDYELPERVDNQVKLKLQKALSLHGISAQPDIARFAMVPQVMIIDENTTATIPVYCDVAFELTISLSDVLTGKVFATFSKSVKARGTNKVNAISKGISSIGLNTPDFVQFVEDSKQKIARYYEENLNAIVARANAAAASGNWEEALYVLSEVPEEVPSFPNVVAPLALQFYQSQIDQMAENILVKARAAWSASPDEAGATKAAEILSEFPEGSKLAGAAVELTNEMKKKVEYLDLREWNLRIQQIEQANAERMKQMDYAHQEKSLQMKYSYAESRHRIEAARQVGVAYAQNQPARVTKVILWR